MIKYDDFAMPSLENIENMAKAYAEMERNTLNAGGGNGGKVKEDYSVVADVYESIFHTFSVLSSLSSFYPKNRKFFILSEKVAKIKAEFESDFLEYNLKIPTTKYSFAESTVAYDLIRVWCKVCTKLLGEFKSREVKVKYLNSLLDLISEMVKY